MAPMTSARFHILLSAGTACGLIALAIAAGAFLGDWKSGLYAGLIGAAFQFISGYLVRHRTAAAVARARHDGGARGYADGLSHGLLGAVASYEATVFPQHSDGVSAEEREARRTAAYKVAAADELPTAVRHAAATALAELDKEDRHRAQDAMTNLFTAVQQQIAAPRR
ncbi:hypothetical protein ACWGH2_41990 [Streptomyces sp. NPDC054871]